MLQPKDQTEPHGFSIKHKKEEKYYWMCDWSLVLVFLFVCLFSVLSFELKANRKNEEERDEVTRGLLSLKYL